MSARTLSRGVLAVAAAALLAACGAKEPPAPVVRPVVLTKVTVGAGANSAVFAGEVRPRHETDLGFRIAGKLAERLVDVGTQVRRGQALARLDPADVGLQADAAKAQVAATETEYKFAQAEYDRYQGLLREKFISASALDAKRNAADTNRAKWEQAKANLAVAQNQRGYATLVANADGVITSANAEPGQVVTVGQAVVRLARDTEREVLISVPENRLRELTSAGQLVVALWANPGKIYQGKVREVSPAVDPATRTFAVRVSILDADPTVRWGMTANVGALSATAAPTAVLPLTSIYQKDGEPAVWRYDATTHAVTLIPIIVAQYREDGVVVTGGVADGDVIVAAGVHKLQPGQVVKPYEGGTQAKPATPPATAGRDAAGVAVPAVVPVRS
ncbi:MAG: efflux RND transporter periplasmic adaptor subunit [Casimicrobiaceae bacterium]